MKHYFQSQHRARTVIVAVINQDIVFTPIGIVSSCFKQKFGIPRQPGLASAATATLTFFPPFNRQELFEGIDAFSHLWIHFIFHATSSEGWRPTVRPPRLGGKQRRGIFATRTTHRPNPLGSSVVALKSVEVSESKGIVLHLAGVDLLDQTPVIDIKPYLPYSDSIDSATEYFLASPAPLLTVEFTAEAYKFCCRYFHKTNRDIQTLITQVLQQDPRPAYLRTKPNKDHWISLWNTNIHWKVTDKHITVVSIEEVNIEEIAWSNERL